MITNERQHRISCAQIEKLRKAMSDLKLNLRKTGSDEKVLATAQLSALESEYEILTEQVVEYEVLKSGVIISFEAESLEELPKLLIKARIAKGLSQRDLANLLGVKEQQIQRYEAEMYASASLRRLSEVEEVLNLKVNEIAELTIDQTKPDIEWKKFPIIEMYKRDWFEGFEGSLEAALANGEDLVKRFIQLAYPRPIRAFTHKHVRAGSSIDPYALLAWQFRIAWLAQKENLSSSYTKNTISPDWLHALAKLSKREDGPKAAREYLALAGIHLIVEPHLPGTYLDGAAFLFPNGSPVVGLTIRHDRLDNFWFVLFHELAHIAKHLKHGKSECYFDDLDSEPDMLEKEADHFASEALIPHNIWEISLARYVRSEDAIKEFSNELGISPAIIAGRIRREANNFTILINLIGQGSVRKKFPDIYFGQ